MPPRISTKIEDKIVSLFALGLKVPAISEKIKADGEADGTNDTAGPGTVRKVLYANDLMEKGYHRGRKISVVHDGLTPEPESEGLLAPGGETLSEIGASMVNHARSLIEGVKTNAGKISPLSGIMDVDKFIAEANSLLTPLEVEHRVNGELLGSLRSHLDGLEILARALSGQDSELAKLKNKQADYQGQIADLNKQIATWQRHAFKRAEGKPSYVSEGDRG
jgi:hypothetical protein